MAAEDAEAGQGAVQDAQVAMEVSLPPTTPEERHRQFLSCQKMRDRLMSNSPIVSFMVKELEAVGCPITKATIFCEECPPVRAGGFQPFGGGRIILCQNLLRSKATMTYTMTHEMMHLYDQCRFNVDWHNLRHHACSEIRAAALSGECKWSNEVLRRQWPGLLKHFQECVKRRATISVNSNPGCKDEETARRAVLQVFDPCLADTRPFDEIY